MRKCTDRRHKQKSASETSERALLAPPHCPGTGKLALRVWAGPWGLEARTHPRLWPHCGREGTMGNRDATEPLDAAGLRGQEQAPHTWHPAPVLCYVPAN